MWSRRSRRGLCDFCDHVFGGGDKLFFDFPDETLTPLSGNTFDALQRCAFHIWYR